MSEISKRTAIARILSDLIKSDNIIDEMEIRTLDALKAKYHILRKHLVAAQLITFSQAINVLRDGIGVREKAELIEDLKNMAHVDTVFAEKEVLLILAVYYCLNEEHGYSSELLTCESNNIPSLNRKFIVYIESEYDKDINSEIQNEAEFLSLIAHMRAYGFEFIYIPYIIQEFRKKSIDYVRSVIGYMSPAFEDHAIDLICNNIFSLNTVAFTQQLLYKKMGVKVTNTEPALLINIGSSLVPYCGEQTTSKVFTDFLRINITGSIFDEIKAFLESFANLVNVDLIRSIEIRSDKLKYFGFYKALIDLMVFTKSSSDLVVNLNRKHEVIRFKDTNEILRLKPNEAALYCLMIQQTLFDNVNHGLLYRPNDRKKAALNDAYRKLYERISGSEMTKDYNNGIPQVVSHIRKAIRDMQYLKNPEDYMPVKDEENGAYRVNIDPKTVMIIDPDTEEVLNILNSVFWKSL